MPLTLTVVHCRILDTTVLGPRGFPPRTGNSGSMSAPSTDSVRQSRQTLSMFRGRLSIFNLSLFKKTQRASY